MKPDPERQLPLRNVVVPADRTRQLDSVSNISRNSIHRIMKKHKFELYKIHLAHQQKDDDLDRRQEFCEIITTRIDTVFHSQLLISLHSSWIGIIVVISKMSIHLFSTTFILELLNKTMSGPEFLVTVLLNQYFPEVGRGCLEWPGRSPDLNPLDFFLLYERVVNSLNI